MGARGKAATGGRHPGNGGQIPSALKVRNRIRSTPQANRAPDPQEVRFIKHEPR